MKGKFDNVPLVLRLTTGFLWIWMGIVPKFLIPEPRFKMVSKSWALEFLGISPEIFIYILGMIVTIVGLMTLLGLYMKQVAVAQIILISLFIIGLAPMALGQGISSPLSHLLLKDIPALGVALTLYITGAGSFSLDEWRMRK